MAQETLAQPYAWDGSWKKGDGTSKGSWVYDSATWKPITELYVWDGGSWKINHPVHVVSCVIANVSNGTCGAVDASYLIQSTWFGPMPQSTAGTGDRYQVEHWDRIANTAQDIFNATWVLRGTFALTTNLISPTSIFFGFVIEDGGANNRKFHQAKAQLIHNVHGDVPFESGGLKSSSVRNFFIDDCDG